MGQPGVRGEGHEKSAPEPLGDDLERKDSTRAGDVSEHDSIRSETQPQEESGKSFPAQPCAPPAYRPIFLQAIAARGRQFARFYGGLTRYLSVGATWTIPLYVARLARDMHADARTVAGWLRVAVGGGDESGWRIEQRIEDDGRRCFRLWRPHVAAGGALCVTTYIKANDPTHCGQWLNITDRLWGSGLSPAAQELVAYCGSLTMRTRWRTIERKLRLSESAVRKARQEAYDQGWLDWTPKSTDGKSTGMMPLFTVRTPPLHLQKVRVGTCKKCGSSTQLVRTGYAISAEPTDQSCTRAVQEHQPDSKSAPGASPVEVSGPPIPEALGRSVLFKFHRTGLKALRTEVKHAGQGTGPYQDVSTDEDRRNTVVIEALAELHEGIDAVTKSPRMVFRAIARRRLEQAEAARVAHIEWQTEQAEREQQNREAEECQRGDDEQRAELVARYSDTFLAEVKAEGRTWPGMNADELRKAVEVYAQIENINLADPDATSEETSRARMDAKAEAKRRDRDEARRVVYAKIAEMSSKPFDEAPKPTPKTAVEQWNAMDEQRRRDPDNLRFVLIEARRAGDGDGLLAVACDAAIAGQVDIEGQARDALGKLQQNVGDSRAA